MSTLKKLVIFSLLMVITLPTFVRAEVGRKTPSPDGTISAGPYYNPATKSYFELFKMLDRTSHTNRWVDAKIKAETKSFKGTQGRLAIVNNLATHQFFTRQFRGEFIWIGLQYFCKTKSLIWVDGSNHDENTQFSVWDSQWASGNTRCADMGHMGVYYSSDNMNFSPRWRAVGPHIDLDMFLVEYPTGEE